MRSAKRDRMGVNWNPNALEAVLVYNDLGRVLVGNPRFLIALVFCLCGGSAARTSIV